MNVGNEDNGSCYMEGVGFVLVLGFSLELCKACMSTNRTLCVLICVFSHANVSVRGTNACCSAVCVREHLCAFMHLLGIHSV